MCSYQSFGWQDCIRFSFFWCQRRMNLSELTSQTEPECQCSYHIHIKILILPFHRFKIMRIQRSYLSAKLGHLTALQDFTATALKKLLVCIISNCRFGWESIWNHTSLMLPLPIHHKLLRNTQAHIYLQFTQSYVCRSGKSTHCELFCHFSCEQQSVKLQMLFKELVLG